LQSTKPIEYTHIGEHAVHNVDQRVAVLNATVFVIFSMLIFLFPTSTVLLFRIFISRTLWLSKPSYSPL